MKVITWNMKRSRNGSESWAILKNLNPDIALLQEVVEIPDDIQEIYSYKFQTAVTKTGQPQRFGTVVLAKGEVSERPLCSEYEWVNQEIENLKGNLLGCEVRIDGKSIRVISVHSPAWPVDANKYPGENILAIRLKENSDLWATEILWSALKNMEIDASPLIVGGDFNCSETFDATFSSGNKEILDRMSDLGMVECLREYNGKLTPTFCNASNKKVLHQIDHLYVNKELYPKINKCWTGDPSIIFDKNISDHLPIIADFT